MRFNTARYQWILFVCFAGILHFSGGALHAQQRPLLTEDPRPIPSGALDAEVGFGYDRRSVYTLSGFHGSHVALLPSGLNFGLGNNAEFQMVWTMHDYLRTFDGVWHRDFGDVSLSTKMKIVGESGRMPIISFRPTVVLPNANQVSGLGLNTTRFFASIPVGKTVGRAFVFGNVGFGIMDHPTIAGVQDDVLTYGLAAKVPVGAKLNWVAELSGVNNSKNSPGPGSETRRQLRSGFQFEAAGVRWDAGVMAGLTDLDPTWGFTFGLTKRFTKHP